MSGGILFAGSPDIAVPALRAAAATSIDLRAVLTKPDAVRGRGRKLEESDIAKAAHELGIPVLKPAKLDAEARAQVRALDCALLVSFAYGKIFGPKFLGLFPGGGVNIHPSLLPKYRGPSPLNAAILNREKETGVTIQRLAEQMDAGNILAQEKIPLDGTETAGTLGEKAAKLAADMLVSLLKDGAGLPEGEPQDEKNATYCHLIEKEDTILDWKRSAGEIDAQIRAYSPALACSTHVDAMHNGKELYIIEGTIADEKGNSAEPGTVLSFDKKQGILIQCGSGIFAARVLQYATKKALPAREFLNGAKDLLRSRLS
jgi:methionyl-tRNA formyltransferase